MTKEATSTLECFRVIQVWDSKIKQWTKPYPPMPIGRSYPGCASYQHYLIVAGGNIEGLIQTTTSVDILDTKSGQWFKAPPMMYNGTNIQSVIIGQSLYLLITLRGMTTSSKSLLRVSLPILISRTLQGKIEIRPSGRRCQMCRCTIQHFSPLVTCC